MIINVQGLRTESAEAAATVSGSPVGVAILILGFNSFCSFVGVNDIYMYIIAQINSFSITVDH